MWISLDSVIIHFEDFHNAYYNDTYDVDIVNNSIYEFYGFDKTTLPKIKPDYLTKDKILDDDYTEKQMNYLKNVLTLLHTPTTYIIPNDNGNIKHYTVNYDIDMESFLNIWSDASESNVYKLIQADKSCKLIEYFTNIIYPNN